MRYQKHNRVNLSVALLGAALLIGSASPVFAARADVEEPGSVSLDAKRKLKLGISMFPGYDITELDQFQASIGGVPSRSWSIWTRFSSPSPDFPKAAAEGARERGAVPFIWWTPSGAAFSRNLNITNGDHDAYIRAFARDAKAFGSKILMRFAHQGNADYTPWGWDYRANDDNTLATYKAMLRYVHDIFEEEGVDNVKWVWTIATQTCAADCLTSPLGYPGHDYVDYMGFTWENWGAAPEGSDTPSEPWISMYQGFKPIVKRLEQVSGKPILAAAIATAPDPGHKARWIRKGYKRVYRDLPRVKGIMYLNNDLSGDPWFDRDWSLHGSPLNAYARIAAMSEFRGRFE